MPFSCQGITHDRGFAIVARMVGPAVLIQYQISVNESMHSVVEAANNIMGIKSRVSVGILPGMTAVFNTGFGTYKQLIGKTSVSEGYSLEMVSRIPMETYCPDNSVGFIINDIFAAFQHSFLIVVPDHNDCGKPQLVQRRSEVIQDEIALLCGRIYTRIPCLSGFGLILG